MHPKRWKIIHKEWSKIEFLKNKLRIEKRTGYEIGKMHPRKRRKYFENRSKIVQDLKDLFFKINDEFKEIEKEIIKNIVNE